MKHHGGKIIFQVLLLFLFGSVNAQQQKLEDSLRMFIREQKNDTNEVNALAILGVLTKNADSILICGQQAQELSKALNYQRGMAHSLVIISRAIFAQGDLSGAIQSSIEALNIYEKLNDKAGITTACLFLQGTYRDGVKDYGSALKYSLYGVEVAEKNKVIGSIFFPGHRLTPIILAEIGQTYLSMNKLDSALYYTRKSIAYNEQFNGAQFEFPIYLLATIQRLQGNYKEALENYRFAKFLTIPNDFPRDTIQINSDISALYKNRGELDSAKYYAISVVQSWNNLESEAKNLLEALNTLGQVYKLKGEKDSAIKYIELFHTIKDSIFSEEKIRDVQKQTFREQIKQQEIATARANYKSKVQKIALTGGIMTLLLIAGILWRNNRIKQKSYVILEKQRQETEIQKMKAEQSLVKLREAQSQLIQAEKMASLGELTAGIAHEIQNPLNFVNNFSEVNTELISEMKKEIAAGNYPDVQNIANDLETNMGKITEHGKRADSIVKSMLQHSRTSNGQKEPTDINMLVEEYFRLSYHGLRAKDKSFNAAMHTEFDSSIGNISIIPQDIGRVLLNIYNNAFYAVAERKQKHPDGYDPEVSVFTQKKGDKVVIRILDNGNGVPKKLMDKIFQPFFTTKPTGEGTGLGLSLSYDIIKAHGGELKVDTKEGEGSEFSIELPAN